MPKKILVSTGHRPVTAGWLPTNPGGVLTTVHPSEQRIDGPRRWAWLSGIAGLVANVLLALFYLLARPFSEVQNGFGWLGTAGTGLFVVLNDGEEADGFFRWARPQSRSLVLKFTRQLGTGGP